MGWSWSQLEDTPMWVVQILIKQVKADAVERESEAQRREQEAEMRKRRHR